MTNTPAPRLLPCPFCGTEPVTMKHEGYSSVYCPNEACYVEPACVSRDCNVADRWNTRQAAADLAALPAAADASEVKRPQKVVEEISPALDQNFIRGHRIASLENRVTELEAALAALPTRETLEAAVYKMFDPAFVDAKAVVEELIKSGVRVRA
jgi:hypothetical protein